MTCLYRSDYGPPEPGFDALGADGRLILGFEAHAPLLAKATNRAELEAMERVLARGGSVAWCDQGYGWADTAPVHALFAAILLFVVLPYAIRRLAPRFALLRQFRRTIDA